MVASSDVIHFAEVIKTIYVKKYSQEKFSKIVDGIYFEIFVRQGGKRKRERIKK